MLGARSGAASSAAAQPTQALQARTPPSGQRRCRGRTRGPHQGLASAQAGIPHVRGGGSRARKQNLAQSARVPRKRGRFGATLAGTKLLLPRSPAGFPLLFCSVILPKCFMHLCGWRTCQPDLSTPRPAPGTTRRRSFAFFFSPFIFVCSLDLSLSLSLAPFPSLSLSFPVEVSFVNGINHHP